MCLWCFRCVGVCGGLFPCFSFPLHLQVVCMVVVFFFCGVVFHGSRNIVRSPWMSLCLIPISLRPVCIFFSLFVVCMCVAYLLCTLLPSFDAFVEIRRHARLSLFSLFSFHVSLSPTLSIVCFFPTSAQFLEQKKASSSPLLWTRGYGKDFDDQGLCETVVWIDNAKFCSRSALFIASSLPPFVPSFLSLSLFLL